MIKCNLKNMRHLGIVICLALPLIGHGQETIKLMFTTLPRKLDFYDQKIITENTWKRVYYYENNRVEKIKTNSILRFNSEEFFDIAIDDNQKQEMQFSGTYLFDKNFLCLYDYKTVECPRYKIINLVDNEYLIAEIYMPVGKANAYKTTNRFVMFQRQNMTSADRVFNEKRALMMLKEEPQANANFTSASVQGIWKMLYHYGDLTQNELHKITARNTMELKMDGVFYRTYPNNPSENDTGRYFINEQNLSLFSEIGREYVYKIVNIYDNEYLVTEMSVIRDNGQKSVQRFLYRRINE